eukprot:TRINITY_DN28913_c0_g1_i2.p1 TRINITY_DN28913_c0_g1~~TRINITY_DN28913_c0_g1_i2.p1  ORF type:complete len:612 (-),score=116.69 TRINITY_DN28913_c0_g1_i2:497-2332(-)
MMANSMPASPQSHQEMMRRRDSLKRMTDKSSQMSELPAYRAQLMRVINSWYFESVVGVLISFNVVLTWYETDLNAHAGGVPGWLRAMNLLLLVLYASEVFLRLVTLQGSFFAGCANWDTFDLLLVLTDILFMLLKAILPGMDDNAGIRALRICRSLRMVKAIRIWPPLRELYIMMHGLLGAFKAMVWSFVMLFLILTLFGIIAVETINPIVQSIATEGGFPDCDRCHRAFASVWSSMLTFFQQVVAGDSWGLITIPVMEREPWTQPFFIAVVVTIQFGILNLILVAIVDQAHQSSQDDAIFQARTRQEEFEKTRKEMLHLCKVIDSDSSGTISLDELMVGYESNPELANSMRFLDVKKDDMKILFDVLDQDSDGAVEYEEFVEQLFNMQNQDTGVVLSFIRSYVQDVRKQLMRQNRDLLAVKDICLGLQASPAGPQLSSVTASPMLDMGDLPEWAKASPSSTAESDVPSPPLFDNLFRNPDDFMLPANLRQQCCQSICKVLLEHVQQTCDGVLLEYERSLMLLKESIQNRQTASSTHRLSSDSSYEKSRSGQTLSSSVSNSEKRLAEIPCEGIPGSSANAGARTISQSLEWQQSSGPGSEGEITSPAISRV